MSWLKDTFKKVAGTAVGTAVGGPIGAGLGNMISTKIFGQPTENELRAQSAEDRQADQDNVLEQITLGNEMDIANQKEMFDYRIQSGLNAGMTPYEMYMGPAAGAGGGTTSSGQTLGNNAQSSSNANRELAKRDLIASRENDKDRTVDLMKTVLGNQAQIKSAEIAAGATKGAAETHATASMYSADIQKKIADNKLQLSRDEYENIALPAAAENLKLTKEQLKVATNEVANTEHKWVRKKVLMQLGVDNGIQQLILNRTKYDITDPDSVGNMSDAEYEKVLNSLLSAKAGLSTEVRGLLSYASSTWSWILGKLFPDESDSGPGIDIPSLGNSPGSMDGPFVGHPNMQVR